MAQLYPGDRAPAFCLLDQNDQQVSLKDFSGKKLLVYFYPQADTPGCTKQACSIRDTCAELSRLGAASVGISPDSPDKQKKFDKKFDLDFPLLSDPDHQTAVAYGAWGSKKRYGREYEGIIRSAFLINENGDIVQTWYHVKPLDTVPHVKEALGLP
jgi:peroxiredoxin Q/BCP